MQGRRLSSGLTTICMLVFASVVWWQKQAIYDWWRLRNYQAPAAVAHLADDTTMSASARRLFYVNHPQILSDKTTFNNHCSVSEQTVILGCFVTHDGIYLYGVTDKRLAGIEQVTAAHEMLHAEYERMSSSERARIDSLTQEVFSKSTDQRLKQTIEQYRQRDPSVVPNELHSILATEVQDLNPELEAHYRNYFSDRLKIVGFANQYESEFTSRKAAIAKYDQQLSSLKTQIDNLENQLVATQQSLNSQRQQLDSLLAAGQYDQYNAGVADFNAKVRKYNDGVSKDKQLVNQFNTIVAARNAIALEEQELVKAIDSRVNSQSTK